MKKLKKNNLYSCLNLTIKIALIPYILIYSYNLCPIFELCATVGHT